MARQRVLIVLATCAAALAAAGAAVADTALGVADAVANDRALTCVGAARAGTGTMTVAATLGRATVTAVGARLRLDVRSALVVGYRPKDASRPSYVGARIVLRRVTLAPGADQVALPLAIPVQGSDGSTATLTATETIFLDSPAVGTPQANVLVDDPVCARPAPRTSASVARIAPEVEPSLKALVDVATTGDGAAALADSLAAGTGVSPFAATLAGRAYAGSLAAFASGDGADARVADAQQRLAPAPPA